MGQKTNPNILKTGRIHQWKSKYIEKKFTESSTVILRDLEIKKFIYQIFAKNELSLENCRIYYSESSLQIYISYYSSFNLLNKKIKPKYKNTNLRTFYSKAFYIKKKNIKKHLYAAKNYKKIFPKQLQLKILRNQYFSKKKTQRLSIFNNIKIYHDNKNYITFNQQQTNLFLSKILKSLKLFTNNKHNIFLNLKQLNNETTFFQTISKKQKQKLKENIIKLRKFQQNEFFKKGLSKLNIFVANAHSSWFLAALIATYLKKLKHPNFFLRFLKIALKVLINQKKYSMFEGIQIKIRGRLNGAPRSKHKLINIGKNIPVLTLNSKINYGESTAYTANGTVGIKVWTYQKFLKNYYIQCTAHVKQNTKRYKKAN